MLALYTPLYVWKSFAAFQERMYPTQIVHTYYSKCVFSHEEKIDRTQRIALLGTRDVFVLPRKDN